MIDLDAVSRAAPAGFYIAIRIGFAFPMVEHNRLPVTWSREYAASGFIVHDPVVAWAYRNSGEARWSELGVDDPLGVLDLAKDHGLAYGAVASCTDDADTGQRSFGFFARSDREYAAEELAWLGATLQACHAAHRRPETLTRAELQTLGLVKNGLLMKEIAGLLGVSESAIKQRLKNARLKLNAKTGSHAAAKATMLGLI